MYDSVLILLLSYGHHDLFNQVFCILNNISFDTLTHYNVYKCYRILTGQSRRKSGETGNIWYRRHKTETKNPTTPYVLESTISACPFWGYMAYFVEGFLPPK
jgi:hypothetical protein